MLSKILLILFLPLMMTPVDASLTHAILVEEIPGYEVVHNNASHMDDVYRYSVTHDDGIVSVEYAVLDFFFSTPQALETYTDNQVTKYGIEGMNPVGGTDHELYAIITDTRSQWAAIGRIGQYVYTVEILGTDNVAQVNDLVNLQVAEIERYLDDPQGS